MDFDHVEAATKVDTVARLSGGTSAALRSELAKCQLVCANCHRVRTHTGIRPQTSQQALVPRFDEILGRAPYPGDQRANAFPAPLLLGALPDRLLSELSGVSVHMVGYHRRRVDASSRLEI